MIYIIGAGWHGREVASICGQVLGNYMFLDDKVTGFVDGSRVVGTLRKLDDDAFIREHKFIVAIGDNETRCRIGQKILDKAGHLPVVVHNQATVWSKDIGEGTVIFPHAVISVGSKVGKFCIVNKHATVGHGADLGDGVNLADAAVCSGKVGRMAFLGMHAVAIPGVDIGEGVTMGAGAVAVKHVKKGTVVGIPARPVK
jgi:acetyltransferase EpsM